MFKDISKLTGVKLLKKEEQRVILGGISDCSEKQCSDACDSAGKLGYEDDVPGCKADCNTICGSTQAFTF